MLTYWGPALLLWPTRSCQATLSKMLPWCGMTSENTKNSQSWVSDVTINLEDGQNDPFPKLSAKAMEIRWLIAPVAEVLKHWVGTAIVAWLHELLELSKRMDDLVFGNKKTRRPTPEEARALGAATFAFNATLSKLAWRFHQRGQPFCPHTPPERITICCILVCMPAKQASIQDFPFATRAKASCPW